MADRLDALARQVPVLYPQGQAICRHYAEQATALKRLGTSIGGNDLWIACYSLALGATLISPNVRAFACIEGLTLIDWAAALRVMIKDKNFWSARASRYLRLIFHRVDKCQEISAGQPQGVCSMAGWG